MWLKGYDRRTHGLPGWLGLYQGPLPTFQHTPESSDSLQTLFPLRFCFGGTHKSDPQVCTQTLCLRAVSWWERDLSRGPGASYPQ